MSSSHYSYNLAYMCAIPIFGPSKTLHIVGRFARRSSNDLRYHLRALSLVLRCHALGLGRNASFLSLTEGALFSAMQQIGIVLRYMLWISCHLLPNLRSSFFQVVQAVLGRLGGRIVVLSTSRSLCSRTALVDSSKVLCLRRQRAWWWVGLTRSTCFTGVEVGRICFSN